MIESLLADLKYGARVLSKSPGFAFAAVLSLALGIGVNTTIFSLVNAVLLRPMPFEEPHRLVEVYTSEGDSGYPYATSSYPDFEDFRLQTDVFTGMSAIEVTILNYDRGEGPAELIFGEAVSGNYFELLGVDAEIGRTFAPEEDDVPGSHPVVVLGHGFWARRFDSDADVVGRTVKLSGQTLTIIGVVPEWFTGTFPLFAPDVWTTMAMQPFLGPGGPDPDYLDERGSRSLFVKARLEPGVTLDEAGAQMNTVMARLAAEYPDTDAGRSVHLLPTDEVRIHPFVDGAILPAAGLLMGVVSLVLLIACANVANMLLSRATARRQEIAVRLALGAGRGRLVRQLLTESVLLAAGGATLGLLLTYWTQGLLLAFQPPVPISIALDLSIDVRVLGFTLLAALVTAMLFGLAPALQSSRPQLFVALKDDVARGGVRGRRFGLRNALVVAQVAFSMVLLVTAGLFARSLGNARRADLGFSPEGVVQLTAPLEMAGYDEREARQFYQRLSTRLEGLPGVERFAYVERVPLGMGIQTSGFAIEGVEPPPGDDDFEIDLTNIGVGYFETLEIPLVAGRAFTDNDREGSLPVVIVNETLARSYWPGENPIGKRISRGGPEGPWMEVVGVARDHKVRTIGEDYRPYIMLPLGQNFDAFASVLVRTGGDVDAMVETVRQQMLELEPGLVFLEAKPMTENLEILMFPVRMGAGLLAVFGLLAVGLAGVGLYGVIAYAVSRRTHEIGLRMALGAAHRDVQRLVVSEGMAIVAVGLALGVIGAAGITWLASTFLYGISALDPVTFGVTALVLAAVGLVANLIPARRAANVDPVDALRYL